MNQFANIHVLEAWLGKHGINYETWGEKSSKSLYNLWQELEAGEVRLKVVDVVQVIIRRDDTVLVEAEQEFFNGKRRHRDQPPSEKIKPGEALQDAAHRCLREELGVSPERIVLHMESHRQHQTNANSFSYPGLPSRYNVHVLEAAVSGLPEEDFWRENQTGDTVDPVRRHRWVWCPIDSVNFFTNQ